MSIRVERRAPAEQSRVAECHRQGRVGVIGRQVLQRTELESVLNTPWEYTITVSVVRS